MQASTGSPSTPRGSLSIYKNLFGEDQPTNTIDLEPNQREKKVSCILDYYYFTGQQEIIINGKPARINYSSLLEIVSDAFFISTFTLHDIIKANSEKLAMVKQEWKTKSTAEMKKSFSAKWPQFVW